MPVDAVSVSPSLRTAISRAGERNGVDFDYLLQTAMRESRLDPQARAATSSAVGLFQFIESTWLEVLKEEGPALGYGDLAAQISREADGGYSVADAGARARILALRENPQMAADLAAAFTRANGEYLFEKFGRMPSPGELYIAHFLGAQGAERFLSIGLSDPNGVAAGYFPRQASANPSIFYEGDRPRTIREVYRALVAEHGQPGAPAGSAQFAAQQMAAGAVPLSVEVMLPSAAMSFTGFYGGDGSAPAAAPAPTGRGPAPSVADGRPTEDEFASFFNRMAQP